MHKSNIESDQVSSESQENHPGNTYKMDPEPVFESDKYIGSGKLKDKVALITGGATGIGRAVAIAFAKEGANLTLSYLKEDKDAEITKKLVEGYGVECLLYSGDIGEEKTCKSLVELTISKFGKLDIVINNAAEQHRQENVEDIPFSQIERTFKTNVFSVFHLLKYAVPHLKEGSTIVNSVSIVAYAGSAVLLDYSATKGALVSLTRSLSENLILKGIRVNAVAPGPIWTPLIPASFPTTSAETFGKNTPMGRAGQPAELAPAYVYLASSDSSYVTGQVIHVNGGSIING